MNAGDEPTFGSETTIGSRNGFAGRLISVRVDTVRLPNGQNRSREVVEHPGAVAILALTPERDVILIRHYRHAAGKTLLELPAGTREPDEPPADTASRELIEETGYVPDRLTELVTFYPTPGYCTERITLFFAEDCRPEPKQTLSDEVIDVVTMPLASIHNLFLDGPTRIEDGKTLIGLMWLLNGPNSVPIGRKG